MELLELGPGIEPELLDEGLPRSLVGGERVGLAPGAVEREHQLAPEPLAQRVARDEALELRHQLGVAAGLELGADQVLRRREPQLFEPEDLRLREGLERELGERIAAPEGERVAQHRDALLRLPPRGVVHERLEPVQVDLLLGGREHVARRPGDDELRPEQPPQRGDEILEGRRRRSGRGLAPERVDQESRRGDLARAQEENGEERSLLRPAEGDRLAAVADDLEGPEDPEVGHHFDSGLLRRELTTVPRGSTALPEPPHREIPQRE